MVAKMTELTKLQNDLLATFVACLANTQESIEKLAASYKACVDAEIVMDRHCPPGLAFRLLNIAEGKLLPRTSAQLLLLPDATVAALSTLPKIEQQTLWENGALVWRDDKEQVVPLLELRSTEVRRLVDTTGGKGRLLSPEEQKNRTTPTIVKRDHEVTIRLTYEDKVEAAAWAHRQGKSLETLLLAYIREQTGLDKPKRTRAMKKVA